MSSQNQGPGYTINDLVYWGGLMAGLGVTYLALKPLGWHPIVQLLLSLVAGVGVGYVCEKIYDQSKRRPGPPGPPD
jgi:hypothetical protein